MLGGASNEVTPAQSPAISAKASPRPYQLPEKLVTISKYKFHIYSFLLML